MLNAARRWLTGTVGSVLVAVLLGVSLTLTTVTLVKLTHQSSCLSRWADKYTARVQSLTTASNARQQALDDFLRSLNTRDQVKERAAYNAYLTASDTYKRQQQAHPVPDSPRLNC